MKCPEAVLNYFDAYNRHDAKSVCETLTEDGKYIDPMAPDGVSGAGFLAMTEGFMAAFGDLSLEILAVIDASDELVAVQWVMRGTHTGTLGPLPRTDRKVTLWGVDVFQLRNGKIQRIEGYYDTGTLYRQLGRPHGLEAA
jgi:steroid delta-isomerase-like uncharacterized protein